MADDNPALEAFLAAGQPEAEPPPPPAPPPATEPEPKSDPKPAATEAVTPPPAEDDPDDGSGTVPIGVLRKSREDWKARTARTEGELAAVKAQLEELRRPPPPPQPAEQRMPRQPPPNPGQDPEGYHGWMQRELIDRTLNMSEAALRRAIGAEAVRDVQEAFRSAAEADPTLWGKLYSQPDPYEWAHQQVQQQRAIAEIGTDPNAYREKLRAEIEARVREELQGQQAAPQQPPPSPAAGIPPSLANVRSSAPRGQAFSGPPAIEDIVGRRSGDLFVRQR